MARRINRRGFVAGSTAAGIGFYVAGDANSQAKASQSPLDKIRIAGVGVGGKGSSDIDQAGNVGDVVAICDIDDDHLNGKSAKFPKAEKFNDFRKMLEKLDKSIDAVVISTPDHTHAPAAAMAMRMGKHVYVQKPLTHTVKEARVLRELAKEKKLCTQMGNQGTAESGLRKAVELVHSGVLGDVKEFHVWTNRPVWPQSPTMKSRPPEIEVPKTVHWDEFLGPAPLRPFAGEKNQRGRWTYHPFNWRGWWDFGTGALGDMACHTANMSFMALKLGYPVSIKAESEDLNPETYPAWAHVAIDFPEREGMVPCTMHWYEGRKDGKLVHPPEALQKKVLKPGARLVDSGSIIVGSKAILHSPNDYGAAFQLFTPEGEPMPTPEVAPKLPRNGKGDQGMKDEWARAIKEGKPEIAMSNFDYAGMLTEAILLGNVAVRAGKKLVWDGPSLRFTNLPEANQFLHKEYRKGWTL